MSHSFQKEVTPSVVSGENDRDSVREVVPMTNMASADKIVEHIVGTTPSLPSKTLHSSSTPKQSIGASSKQTVSGDLSQNVGTKESTKNAFFLELEDPKTWLSTNAKLNAEWKQIIQVDNDDKSSFDALAYECPLDWIEYGRGNKPGWGQPW
ncbi:hypothetical protein QYF36_015769 [Acer negundo]|nr:hypothetical protein QYF36_015769 [Acer negundo]